MFCIWSASGNPSEENCELLLNEILQSLSQGEADAAYLNFLRSGSELCRLSSRKPSVLCRDYIRITQKHFAAVLPATVEEFYRGLSSGSRWQIKLKQKKLLKDFGGDVRIRCFRDVAELENLIQDVEQVAKTTYQRGLGVGFIDSLVDTRAVAIEGGERLAAGLHPLCCGLPLCILDRRC